MPDENSPYDGYGGSSTTSPTTAPPTSLTMPNLPGSIINLPRTLSPGGSPGVYDASLYGGGVVQPVTGTGFTIYPGNRAPLADPQIPTGKIWDNRGYYGYSAGPTSLWRPAEVASDGPAWSVLSRGTPDNPQMTTQTPRLLRGKLTSRRKRFNCCQTSA